MPREIQAGDRVRYAAKFLRSIACHTGRACFIAGTVTAVRRHGAGMILATVAWDDADEDGAAVNVTNLVRVEDMHLECVL